MAEINGFPDESPGAEMKQARREAVASSELTAAELSLIEASEIPDEHRYGIDE